METISRDSADGDRLGKAWLKWAEAAFALGHLLDQESRKAETKHKSLASSRARCDYDVGTIEQESEYTPLPLRLY